MEAPENPLTLWPPILKVDKDARIKEGPPELTVAQYLNRNEQIIKTMGGTQALLNKYLDKVDELNTMQEKLSEAQDEIKELKTKLAALRETI